jgi:hypothetical protein
MRSGVWPFGEQWYGSRDLVNTHKLLVVKYPRIGQIVNRVALGSAGGDAVFLDAQECRHLLIGVDELAAAESRR